MSDEDWPDPKPGTYQTNLRKWLGYDWLLPGTNNEKAWRIQRCVQETRYVEGDTFPWDDEVDAALGYAY